MARASPNGALIIAMAGMAILLCGGLVLTMEFAKREIKTRKPEEKQKPPAEPEGPWAARIKLLDNDQFAVTQRGQDDPAWFRRYVNHTEPGLYLDVVSGEVLFSSLHKLEPVLGYAEFSRPFDAANVVEKEANVTGAMRLEARSKAAHSYLGWIVNDDPGAARRYVINSSALRFVPVSAFEANGLGQHRALFP